MPKRTLHLRSFRMVASAYIIGLLVGLTVLSFVWALPSVSGRNVPGAWSGIAGMWLGVVETGWLPCFVVELVLATPLLFAFRQYGRGWFNGWLAGARGLAAGFINFFVADLCIFGGPIDFSLLRFSLCGGLLGLVTGLVFRIIAVRADVRAIAGLSAS